MGLGGFWSKDGRYKSNKGLYVYLLNDNFRM